MIPISTEHNILKFLVKYEENKENKNYLNAPSVLACSSNGFVDEKSMRTLFVERGLAKDDADFDSAIQELRDGGFLSEMKPLISGTDKVITMQNTLAARMLTVGITPQKQEITETERTELLKEI